VKHFIIKTLKLTLFQKIQNRLSQIKVKGLSGGVPNEGAWVGVAWGSVSGKASRGTPLLSIMRMKCIPPLPL
jgi:hypothetical protein